MLNARYAASALWCTVCRTSRLGAYVISMPAACVSRLGTSYHSNQRRVQPRCGRTGHLVRSSLSLTLFHPHDVANAPSCVSLFKTKVQASGTTSTSRSTFGGGRDKTAAPREAGNWREYSHGNATQGGNKYSGSITALGSTLASSRATFLSRDRGAVARAATASCNTGGHGAAHLWRSANSSSVYHQGARYARRRRVGESDGVSNAVFRLLPRLADESCPDLYVKRLSNVVSEAALRFHRTSRNRSSDGQVEWQFPAT